MTTKTEWRSILLVAAAIAGPIMCGGEALAAQESAGIPPDTVITVFVSDTIDGFGAVGGVAVDALGYVYIADFRNAVWRLSPEGQLTNFADGLYGASGNAIGPRGDLFQSSFHGHFISRISRTGEVEVYVDEGLNGPVGIAASPSGELFVANCRGGSVLRVGVDRSVTEVATGDLFACPNGVTFDDRGDLYVVNFNNTKVVRITPDGVASEFVDIPGGGGNGHITFGQGSLYVTKFRGNQVYRVGRDGSVSVIAGTGAAGETDGPALTATFTQPNGIAASPSGKELWVNDLTITAAAGQGAALVALRRIRLVSLSDVLGGMDPELGVDGVRELYHGYHASRAQEDTDADATTLAYLWLTSGRVGEALALFEMNAQQFPNSSAAQFNYGESFRYTGQPERAAAAYRRALELQPDHVAAAAQLAAIGGGPK